MMSLPPPPKLHTPKSTVTQKPVDAFKHIIRTIFPTHAIKLDAFFEYFGTDNVNDFITMKDDDLKLQHPCSPVLVFLQRIPGKGVSPLNVL
jgi:hypothetical protein